MPNKQESESTLRLSTSRRSHVEQYLCRRANGLMGLYAINSWRYDYSIPVDAMDEGLFSHRTAVATLRATAPALVVKDKPPLLLGEAIYEDESHSSDWPKETRLIVVDLSSPRLDASSSSVNFPSRLVAGFRKGEVYSHNRLPLEFDELGDLDVVFDAMGAYYADRDTSHQVSIHALEIPPVES